MRNHVSYVKHVNYLSDRIQLIKNRKSKEYLGFYK